VVDNTVYIDGQRRAEPASLTATYDLLRDQGGMAWISLYRPDRSELLSVSNAFAIRGLAVEDTVRAHQRPRAERYAGVLFTTLRPARYLDPEERVEFGELHVVTGCDFVVTIRHAESPDLERVRSRLEAAPELLRLGPEAVLYAIVDQVVDEYAPVVDGLENDIEEIEDQVFTGDAAAPRRIYQLLREVVEFHRAAQPLIGMLDALSEGFATSEVEENLDRHVRHVRNNAVHVVERVDGFRALLQNVLTVNATLVGQRQNEETQRLTETSLRQNEEVKRISAWAAILFAPTLVGTVYGMNFDHMPELDWRIGYPFSLLLMALVSTGLYLVFKRRGWF